MSCVIIKIYLKLSFSMPILVLTATLIYGYYLHCLIEKTGSEYEVICQVHMGIVLGIQSYIYLISVLHFFLLYMASKRAWHIKMENSIVYIQNQVLSCGQRILTLLLKTLNLGVFLELWNRFSQCVASKRLGTVFDEW